jgi:N-acetylneuraminic acid mutarotase
VAREAVLGDSGLVTVAGGLVAGNASTASAYTLDLRTGRTRTLPDLAVPVHDTAGAIGARQRLVVGGGSSSEQDVVQRWSRGRWSVVGHLPQARSDLSAVVVAGRVVVLGGYQGSSPAVAGIVSSGDGVAWRRIGTLAVPVRYAATAVTGGKIWLFGGEVNHAMQSSVQRVDPVSGKARVVALLPGALGHAVAVNLGGRILLVGGRTSSTALTRRMWWFDPATLETSHAGRLPVPLADSAAVTRGSSAYLIGGETPSVSDRVLRLSLR